MFTCFLGSSVIVVTVGRVAIAIADDFEGMSKDIHGSVDVEGRSNGIKRSAVDVDGGADNVEGGMTVFSGFLKKKSSGGG